MEDKTLMNCSTAEFYKVIGLELNEDAITFLNEWERVFKIGMSSQLDEAIWGNPREGYHQFLFDDDGA